MGQHYAVLHLALTFVILPTVQGCWNATAGEQKQSLTISINATNNRSEHCWRISVDPRHPNHRIEIRIVPSFKCGIGDTLRIKSEIYTSSMACRRAQSSPHIFEQPSIFVHFKSGKESGDQKLSLTVQAIPKPKQATTPAYCETAKRATWYSQHQYLVSPGYPVNYHPNLNICWILEAESDETVILQILDLSLESSSSCRKDFVEIRDGGGPNAILVAKWCRFSDTRTLQSTGNSLFVRFRSDYSGESRGFKFHFSQKKKQADRITPSITMSAIAFGTMVICAILIYRRCMCHKRRLRRQQEQQRQQHPMSNINVHMSPVQNVTISNSNGTSIYGTPTPSPPPYSAIGVSNPAVVDQEDLPPSYDSIAEQGNPPSAGAQENQ